MKRYISYLFVVVLFCPVKTRGDGIRDTDHLTSGMIIWWYGACGSLEPCGKAWGSTVILFHKIVINLPMKRD